LLRALLLRIKLLIKTVAKAIVNSKAAKASSNGVNFVPRVSTRKNFINQNSLFLYLIFLDTKKVSLFWLRVLFVLGECFRYKKSIFVPEKSIFVLKK
jgi:hypothetical protein